MVKGTMVASATYMNVNRKATSVNNKNEQGFFAIEYSPTFFG